MAKDDMPVLFCKVLIYLYKVLKGKQERDEYYIQPMTNNFPISETYLQTVLVELQGKGCIRNLHYKTAFGGDVVYFNYNNIEITYDGVEFLIVPSGHGGSQLFKGRKVEVSINPTTGNLIQTNPLSYKGSWNKND